MWYVINRQPGREDIINIVHRMYIKDGLSFEDVSKVVDTFPNQGNHFSRTVISFCSIWNKVYVSFYTNILRWYVGKRKIEEELEQ